MIPPVRKLRAAAAALMVLLLVLGLTVPGPAPGRAAAASPGYSASIDRIDHDLRRRITGSSWHHGCPVPISKLRLLRVRHWNFRGRPARGYLIVHAGAARPMVKVMHRLFKLRYRIRRMRLVDAYGADDHRSMRADNTSAFNCREVSGRPGVWSQHAYGRAIDINSVENPYVTGSGFVSPPNGTPFAIRRPHRKGMISRRGKVVRTFARFGWEWGGNWSGTRDYQHFSTTGT